MSKLLKNIKKYRLVVGLVSLCLLLFTIQISHAAYISGSYKKGVAYALSKGTRFSSNYLSLHANNVEDENIDNALVTFIKLTEGNLTTRIFDIDIRNYSQNNPNSPNNETINYDLFISVIPENASYTLQGGYSINTQPIEKVLGENKYTYTIPNQTLQGGIISKNSYAIQFPYEELGDIIFLVKAIPTNTALTDDKILAANLHMVEQQDSVSENFNWTGNLQDKPLVGTLENSKDSQKQSAINYTMTGLGQCTIKLTWDNTKFLIDPFFTEGTQSVNGINTTLSLPVDSNIKDYYSLQFYRKLSIDENETWDILTNEFTFELIL